MNAQKTKTIQVQGVECESAGDAMGWLDALGGGYAIQIGGKTLVVQKPEATRLECMGLPFSYLFDHDLRDGRFRIMAVPVN